MRIQPQMTLSVTASSSPLKEEAQAGKEEKEEIDRFVDEAMKRVEGSKGSLGGNPEEEPEVGASEEAGEDRPEGE